MPQALVTMYEQMDSVARKELYDFAVFLMSRKRKDAEEEVLAKIGTKPIDDLYNQMVSSEKGVVCSSARHTLWEQIKDDAW